VPSDSKNDSSHRKVSVGACVRKNIIALLQLGTREANLVSALQRSEIYQWHHFICRISDLDLALGGSLEHYARWISIRERLACRQFLEPPSMPAIDVPNWLLHHNFDGLPTYRMTRIGPLK
jgi:hypothetical protein